MDRWSLDLAYDAFPRIEPELQAMLGQSLQPGGPGLLLDLAGGLGLPAGAAALDVGCGEGRHAMALADRFGFAVRGIDPVPRHIEAATAAAAGRAWPRGAAPVFELGRAEQIPVPSGAADLIWCRDVLVHVDLTAAFAEFRRVLRPGGLVLTYQMFGTDRLEPREGNWLCDKLGIVPASADRASAEAAIAAAGLRVEQRVDVGSEWGERAQEDDGSVGDRLLHAARLLRSPERYAARFGPAACDLMLADCLWQVYSMIGKLSRVIYVLSGPAGMIGPEGGSGEQAAAAGEATQATVPG